MATTTAFIGLTCNEPIKSAITKIMKTSIKNLFLLPTLIASLSLILAGRVTAQTYAFGPEVTTTNTASIIYNSDSNTFQYTNAANSVNENVYLPLTGTAATFITTTNGWTASINVNLSAKSSINTASGEDPHATMLLGVANSNDLTNHSVGYTVVNLSLDQMNNTGGGDDSDYPDGWYGAAAKFGAHLNGAENVTTRLGNSYTNSGGGCYLPLSGGTNASPATESINATNGVLTLNYNASTKTVTGYFNTNPIASYPLAGWGSNPPLTLVVFGGSGQGVGVAAGMDTASEFFAGILPQLAIVPSGGNMILTWPTNDAGFTLQSTTNLSSPVWSAVLPAHVIFNGQNIVTNPISGTQMFYRLSQ
jgi:hypothetical protein